jgi:hypothetical protein
MVDEKPVLSLSSVLFPRVFQAFRLAIQPSKLALALAAVAIIGLTGWIMDQSRSVVTGPYVAAPPQGQIRMSKEATELDVYLLPGASLENFIEARKATGDRAGVFGTLARVGAREFHTALYAVLSLNLPEAVHGAARCLKALLWAFRWHPIYSLVLSLVAFVVLSLAGGAICRIAALQFARAERSGLTQAVRFSLRRSVSLLGGPIAPGALVFVFGLPIMFLGLAGNLPWVGELLTGLFLLPAFLAAGAITIILIGAVGGWGLMFPAVAYEDSDSFDAISRSLGYVYNKPWHMGFYTVTALVYGALCYLFVRFFAFVLLWTTHRFLAVGFGRQNEKLYAIWPEPTFTSLLGPTGIMPDTWSLWLAALLVRIWVLGIIGLLVAFLLSFYFSANTIIYALMRQRVDGTPLGEVYASPDAQSARPVSSAAEPGADLSEPALQMDGGTPPTSKTSG